MKCYTSLWDVQVDGVSVCVWQHQPEISFEDFKI